MNTAVEPLSRIKWIMFDADNTLLDFENACKHALIHLLDHYNIEICTETVELYEKINAGVWAEFEDGQISALTLRSRRFELFFHALSISSIDPVAANAMYLKKLVEVSKPYEGVEDLLVAFRPHFHLSIITNGLKEVQKPRLERLRLSSYFDSIIVSDEIGSAKPDPTFFDFAFNSMDHSIQKEEILVVGDSLKSDIAGGRAYGMKTCWISHGKNNPSSIQPDLICTSVSELPATFKGLLT